MKISFHSFVSYCFSLNNKIIESNKYCKSKNSNFIIIFINKAKNYNFKYYIGNKNRNLVNLRIFI
jgi:hypothetical protein